MHLSIRLYIVRSLKMCMRMLIYLEDVLTKLKNYLFDRTNYLTLAASLTGVTSLIFCAKGNPFGQLPDK